MKAELRKLKWWQSTSKSENQAKLIATVFNVVMSWFYNSYFLNITIIQGKVIPETLIELFHKSMAPAKICAGPIKIRHDKRWQQCATWKWEIIWKRNHYFWSSTKDWQQLIVGVWMNKSVHSHSWVNAVFALIGEQGWGASGLRNCKWYRLAFDMW